MKDISLSICITTLTSALAFGLGAFSEIPSVRWLCLYAFPSVLIDFAYQITFFIALLVLDERRIQAGRMDCCICVRAQFLDDEVAYQEKGGVPVVLDEEEESALSSNSKDPRVPETINLHWSDRFMIWYADKLLRPKVQIAVLIGFVSLLGVSLYYTTQLTQFFDLNDMVPQDSYLKGYFTSLSKYAKNRTGLPSYAFFRNIDHSDPAMREQMVEFVDQLVKSGSIVSPPTHFWINDFNNFIASNTNMTFAGQGGNETFYDQVAAFLQEPLYNELYHDHIILNSKTGYILDSRCEIYVNVDIGDAKGGIDALERLRSVSMAQPINENVDHSEWKMFTYQDMYNLWEFYSAVISELSFSTVVGVVAVCMVGFLLIPHWTAVLYMAPLIICLYIDMLGES